MPLHQNPNTSRYLLVAVTIGIYPRQIPRDYGEPGKRDQRAQHADMSPEAPNRRLHGPLAGN